MALMLGWVMVMSGAILKYFVLVYVYLSIDHLVGNKVLMVWCILSLQAVLNAPR